MPFLRPRGNQISELTNMYLFWGELCGNLINGSSFSQFYLLIYEFGKSIISSASVSLPKISLQIRYFAWKNHRPVPISHRST